MSSWLNTLAGMATLLTPIAGKLIKNSQAARAAGTQDKTVVDIPIGTPTEAVNTAQGSMQRAAGADGKLTSHELAAANRDYVQLSQSSIEGKLTEGSEDANRLEGYRQADKPDAAGNRDGNISADEAREAVKTTDTSA